MKKIHYIYLANIFLGFHYYLIVYINSSYLSDFVNKVFLNWIYIAGALLNISLLLIIPRTLSSINPKKLLLFIISIEFLSVFILSYSTSPVLIISSFILQQSVGPLILYFLDLFLESEIQRESNTGRSRAMFLTAINISVIISFGIVTLFASKSFSPIYLISSMMLIPLALLITIKFKNNIQKSTHIRFIDIKKFITKDKDILRILLSNFVLRFFYSTMIIYLPLLLHNKIGFNWNEIGVILVIMLIPFILIEIPAGRLMDKKMGETEMLALGFIIMTVSCINLMMLEEKSLWLWVSILFISRIGAALVEIANETYFFKKVDEKHSSIISLFRITDPLGMVVAPLIALPALLFMSYSGLFGLLGLVTLLGLTTIPKIDTK